MAVIQRGTSRRLAPAGDANGKDFISMYDNGVLTDVGGYTGDFVGAISKGEMALIRFAENATQTFGVLLGGGAGLVGYTMEPGANSTNNWNQVRLREREYGFMKNDGTKFSNDYKLTKNGKGTRYLVHGGTLRSHTRGCILLGDKLKNGNLIAGKSLGVFRNYIKSAGPSNIRLNIYGN